MSISKYKYYIAVVIFISLPMFSLIHAWQEKKTELVTMLVAVIGFFAFIVTDHINQAAATERLEEKVQRLAERLEEKVQRLAERLEEKVQRLDGPLSFIRAEEVRSQLANRTRSIQRLSYTQAITYCCNKVKSAKQMYNTSFSVDMPFAGTSHYKDWLQAIVESITDHKCSVYEVILCKDRQSALDAVFKAYQKPMVGSYIGIDLSKKDEKLRDIPLIEIVLFEDEEGLREVIFGWVSSRSHFAGTTCFLVQNDNRLYEYFEAYITQFESLGKAVTLPMTP